MNANQPAFPVITFQRQHGTDTVVESSTCLTKRELLAAMAMQGLCADPSQTNYDNMVTGAVQIADKLLTELDKTKGE